jgi:hypothetical protein
MTVAHLAGVPVEEALPTLAPMACVLAVLLRARHSGLLRRAEPLHFRRSTR